MIEVAAAMDRLKARFLARAADDLADLKLWSINPQAYADDLHRLVHRLAGAAGTFGLCQLSDLAKVAEDALITAPSTLSAALADVVKELEHVAESAGSTQVERLQRAPN